MAWNGHSRQKKLLELVGRSNNNNNNKLAYGAIRLPFLIKSSSSQIPAYLQEWNFVYVNNTSK